jgi:hypothetical protein
MSLDLGLYCEFEAKQETRLVLGKLGEEQMKRIMGAGLQFDDEEEPVGIHEQMSTQNTIKRQGNACSESEESLSLITLKRRLGALESDGSTA